ncbi:MAG: hypothetical protein GYB67_14680 [Chloroflexi bacterium]|nr:hypothetical protein [Chloroflexota bacterium]
MPNSPQSLHLPRKRALRAHGQRVVFAKGLNESAEHVLMKAFLWALYLPTYPDLSVEVRIGDKYKPDVVQIDAANMPIFWAEAGQVGVKKIESLVRRFRTTHFVIAKWNQRLDPVAGNVRAALNGRDHGAPFDLISFPADSADRFIAADGEIRITHDDVTWLRL